jgi:hypothetical protein
MPPRLVNPRLRRGRFAFWFKRNGAAGLPCLLTKLVGPVSDRKMEGNMHLGGQTNLLSAA